MILFIYLLIGYLLIHYKKINWYVQGAKYFLLVCTVTLKQNQLIQLRVLAELL